MPRQPSLSPAAVKKIHAATDELFDKLKTRFLGPSMVPKRVYVSYTPELSLPGLFMQASREEGNVPDEALLQSLLRVAGGYVDAERERAKAKVVKAVESFMREAKAGGVDTDVETVLGGELSKVWGKLKDDVRRIVDTEATTVRNVGVLDGILKINDAAGITDPVVAFIGPNDEHTCEECRRLLLLEDGVTPKVWRMSEVKHGYHGRGEDFPAIGGLHPNCRHGIISVMPGYGFDKGGSIAYKGPGHDEFKAQRE